MPFFALTDRQIALIAMAAAVFATVFAGIALWQSSRQFDFDYEPVVVIGPGQLPLKKIPSIKPLEFDITVTNTSKVNLSYFLRVNSNTACVSGDEGRPQFVPCAFESHSIPLSKPEAGQQAYTHKLKLQAPSTVDMHPLAYSSEPTHYVVFDVVDARNGKTLKHSKCYYTFEAAARALTLYQPVIDSTGRSKILQAACEG